MAYYGNFTVIKKISHLYEICDFERTSSTKIFFSWQLQFNYFKWQRLFVVWSLVYCLMKLSCKNGNSIAITYRVTSVYFKEWLYNTELSSISESIIASHLKLGLLTVCPFFQTSLFKNKTTRQYKEYNLLPIPDYMSEVNVFCFVFSVFSFLEVL